MQNKSRNIVFYVHNSSEFFSSAIDWRWSKRSGQVLLNESPEVLLVDFCRVFRLENGFLRHHSQSARCNRQRKWHLIFLWFHWHSVIRIFEHTLHHSRKLPSIPAMLNIFDSCWPLSFSWFGRHTTPGMSFDNLSKALHAELLIQSRISHCCPEVWWPVSSDNIDTRTCVFTCSQPLQFVFPAQTSPEKINDAHFGFKSESFARVLESSKPVLQETRFPSIISQTSKWIKSIPTSFSARKFAHIPQQNRKMWSQNLLQHRETEACSVHGRSVGRRHFPRTESRGTVSCETFSEQKSHQKIISNVFRPQTGWVPIGWQHPNDYGQKWKQTPKFPQRVGQTKQEGILCRNTEGCWPSSIQWNMASSKTGMIWRKFGSTFIPKISSTFTLRRYVHFCCTSFFVFGSVLGLLSLWMAFWTILVFVHFSIQYYWLKPHWILGETGKKQQKYSSKLSTFLPSLCLCKQSSVCK